MQSKTWDKFAKIYDKFLRKERPAYEALARLITQHDAEFKTLELCAGTGILTEYIGEAFQDYEASDFSQEMLVQFKEKRNHQHIKYSIIDCLDIDKHGHQW